MRLLVSIPNALPLRYLRGIFILLWSEPKSWATAPLCRLCGGLLCVSVRRNVAHRTLATALGFGRCRHGNVFALSSDVPLHLIFKVLPLSPL